MCIRDRYNRYDTVKIKEYTNESEFITGHHGGSIDLHGDGRLQEGNGKIPDLSDLPADYLCGCLLYTSGGAVEVTINGKKEITSIKLAEEIVDPEDIETLQDAIVAAANEACLLYTSLSVSMRKLP